MGVYYLKKIQGSKNQEGLLDGKVKIKLLLFVDDTYT